MLYRRKTSVTIKIEEEELATDRSPNDELAEFGKDNSSLLQQSGDYNPEGLPWYLRILAKCLYAILIALHTSGRNSKKG